MFADIWPALPEDPTWIFVVCLAMVLGAILLRAYTTNQQQQINGLREALDRQEERHAAEMQRVTEKIERLEAITEDARSERHKLRGEKAALGMALHIVGDLYLKCTCGALDPIAAVLSGLRAQEIG